MLCLKRLILILIKWIDKLPYSIRILLESAIRNCDNFQVTKEDVEKIVDWENNASKQVEIPFKPARVLLQVTNCHGFRIWFLKVKTHFLSKLRSLGFYRSSCSS